MQQMTYITTGDFQYWNLPTDGEYIYTYDSANRLVGVSKTDTSVSYAYNSNGDRLQQTVNGTGENFTLDLNSGLAQVLASQGDIYLYGLNRLGFERNESNYQYLHDGLRMKADTRKDVFYLQ